METQDWRMNAACRGNDPELWFSLNPADRQVAQLTCAGCAVRAECAEAEARAHAGRIPKERWGLWGDVDCDKPRFEALMQRAAERAARVAAAREVKARGEVCRNGHVMSDENRYVRAGERVECRTCRRDADRRRVPRNRSGKVA